LKRVLKKEDGFGEVNEFLQKYRRKHTRTHNIYFSC
jgi:hypothetical protein